MAVEFIITGIKWFDKVNGNTYHAVNITDAKENKLIFSSGLTYGYGDQWQHTAMDALIIMGLWKETDRFSHELKKEKLFFTCNENGLKKDLKKVEVEKLFSEWHNTPISDMTADDFSQKCGELGKGVKKPTACETAEGGKWRVYFRPVTQGESD